jgi:hypothetical protein
MSPSSAESSAETTCASTVGTSSHHPNNTEDQSSAGGNDPRTIMRRQVLHLGLASSSVMGAFVVSVVPANILVGVTLVFLLWTTFLYRVFQLMQFEYQRALNGRGLGDLLPASWYDRLVNVSIHDFMTDNAFMEENQHFFLYFIPGLSRERLDGYVDRLVPRHRRALRQPGLGNFVGDGFMRHVIGDQGLTERQAGTTTRRLVPRRLELAASNEDAASRLGDDDEEDARLWGVEPTMSEEAAAPLEAVIEADPSLEISHDGTEESEESEEDLAGEEILVYDAAFSSMMGMASSVFGFTRQAVTGPIVRTAGTALRATLGIGAVGVGAGLFGLWAGFWTPQDIRTFRDTRFPIQVSSEARTVLMSSTLASGATAGLFMLFGLGSTPAPPAGNQRRRSSAASATPKKTKP